MSRTMTWVGFAVHGRSAHAGAIWCRKPVDRRAQNRCASRSARSTETHPTVSGAAASIHERRNTVLTLPAGAHQHDPAALRRRQPLKQCFSLDQSMPPRPRLHTRPPSLQTTLHHAWKVTSPGSAKGAFSQRGASSMGAMSVGARCRAARHRSPPCARTRELRSLAAGARADVTRMGAPPGDGLGDCDRHWITSR